MASKCAAAAAMSVATKHGRFSTSKCVLATRVERVSRTADDIP